MPTGKTVRGDPDTELVAHETVARKNGIDKPECAVHLSGITVQARPR